MMNSKDKAIQQLKTAEHLLEITFPLVKDPKLLIGVINNLNSCLNHGMEAVFHEDFLVPKSLNGKIDVLLKKHNLPQEHVKLIRKVNQLIISHKESPVVFKRGDRQIICNENYDVEVISAKEVRNLIDTTKEFLSQIGLINRK